MDRDSIKRYYHIFTIPISNWNMSALLNRIFHFKMMMSLLLVLSHWTSLAQTKEICPQPIPPGWVLVGYQSCVYGCCGADYGETVLKPVIQYVDTMPLGSTLEICPQATPPGWVVTDYKQCMSCCGADFGKTVQKPVILKVSGWILPCPPQWQGYTPIMQPPTPAVTRMEVCPGPIPHGWVIVDQRPCAGCCGAAGHIILMPTIEYVAHLSSGATLEICPQPIPFGWVKVSSRPCAGCCGAAGEITQMITSQ